MSTVVGIDLSLTSTGLARVHDVGHIVTTTIATKGTRSDTLAQRRERLDHIAEAVVFFAHPADLVVIEAPAYSRQHGSQHDRSGLWWLIVNALIERGKFVATVSPTARAKYGTGKGNAKKDVVEAFVREAYSDLCESRIRNDDECDAILLAAMGARALGHPLDVALPDNALAAMTGADWSVVDA